VFVKQDSKLLPQFTERFTAGKHVWLVNKVVTKKETMEVIKFVNIQSIE
jgi:hypothetical protein